jgi:hypothetical protein
MIALLLALTAFAADLPKSEFRFKQGKIAFVTDESRKLTISADCRKADGSLKCDATAGLKQLSWKKRKKGDHNPGSTLCEKQLKGTVVVGQSESGDENSFCRFPDGSMVDSGSLIYRARKND